MLSRNINLYTYVSRKINYNELNYENFLKQNRPWDLKKILNIIKKWDQCFKYKYFEFRNKITQISYKNWESLPSKNLKNWNDLLNCENNSIFLFTDDDDLYSPYLKYQLSKIDDLFKYDLVYWNSCEFITSVMYANQKIPKKYSFNFKQKRNLYSNNFAMTLNGIKKLKEEDFVTSQSVNKYFNNLITKYISENLNVGNKTVSSISCLKNISNVDSLKEMLSMVKKIKIPEEVIWAKPYIQKTIELYYENSNWNYLL